ncbi:hypothetical protein F5Y16DRAFT_177098 [Xylariaceae sp. FL0255]|nr:hypothetical protein F5Y16DRAFT_177098 [Xylariaceae sp. FL0255]
MEDYRQFLAQKILTEDQVVTYRLLSRSLDIHVNAAKEMLYDFHKWQNDKKPGTLHATYIVYGTKNKPLREQQDEDVEMTDSQPSDPDHAPFSDTVPATALSLITEDQLQDTLAQYSKVLSIHVYSLAPHPQKDLQLLADTGKQVIDMSLAAIGSGSAKELGTIANPNVRRRERPRGSSAPSSAPKAEPKTAIKQEAKSSTPAAVKEEPKESTQASKKPTASSAPVTKSTPAAISLKRQGSSGIGQMFAKAAANPKKPKPKPEAESPALSDDGEDDTEEPMPDPKNEDKEESSSARQSRMDRQAELRRMMEESDEGQEAEKAESSADEPMEEDEPPPPEPEPEVKAEEPAEVVSSTGDGRRRGRRRVTKKKQIMDEQGYLVTVQEPGWESFSEDEAPPPPPPAAKANAQPVASVKAEPATKPKKAAGKGTQGSIMSFFGKK